MCAKPPRAGGLRKIDKGVGILEKLYRYNRKRGTLHIFHGCQYSDSPEYEQYDTEEEAAAALGYEPKLCGICLKNRDITLRNEKIYKRKRR